MLQLKTLFLFFPANNKVSLGLPFNFCDSVEAVFVSASDDMVRAAIDNLIRFGLYNGNACRMVTGV